MITEFEDFCLWTYVIVDELWRQLAAEYRPATGRSEGAAFGKVPTKKRTIFGYKLHLLVTLNGVIRGFVLAPASESDVTVGAELLREQEALVAIGDKGYISAPLAAELHDAHG